MILCLYIKLVFKYHMSYICPSEEIFCLFFSLSSINILISCQDAQSHQRLQFNSERMRFLIRDLYQSPAFKQYLSLSHIVFRQKYLIPQRPLLPILSFNSLKLSQSKVITHRNLQNNQPARLQSQLKHHNQFSVALTDKQRQKRNEFAEQLEKYHQKYIQPLILFQKKIKPYEIYASQEKETINNAFDKNSKEIENKTIEEHFRKLPTNVRVKYEQKCKQQASERIRKYGPIAARYRIPNLIALSPKELYTQTLNKSKVPANERVAFEKLPYGEQQKYKDFAIRKKSQSINSLKSFLSKYHLNQDKYSQILQVCLRFSKELKALTGSAILQKNFTLESLEEDNTIWLEFFDLSIKTVQTATNHKKRDASQAKANKQPKNQQLKAFSKSDQSITKEKEKKSEKINPTNHKRQKKESKKTQPKEQHIHHQQNNNKLNQKEHFDWSQKEKNKDLDKVEAQQNFDEDQCLNYDYEQIKLMREINKKLKSSTKNQNSTEKSRK